MLQMGNSVITFQVTAFSVSLHFQMMLIFFVLFNFLVNASRFSVRTKTKGTANQNVRNIVWVFGLTGLQWKHYGSKELEFQNEKIW